MGIGPDRIKKKKVCPLCQKGVQEVDYKDIGLLKEFLLPKAQMTARRKSGVCATHQRRLAEAIKNARELALLPFTVDHALTWRT